MGKIEWPSDEELYESIGYLACPGVVKKIEATVPEDRLGKFKLNYKDKYSEEYPYVTKAGSKYGEQLRLYLNDNDGCPRFLREQLDATYGVRLNDTSFLRHIIKVYGFRITNAPQDSKLILEQAKRILSESDFKVFLKGYNRHNEFVMSLKETLVDEYDIEPIFVDPPENKKSKGKLSSKDREDITSSYTKEQLQKIGWSGEKYIFNLLNKHSEELLKRINVNSKEYSVIWFNEGFDVNDDWEDKSVGEGCDLVVQTEDKSIMIEVKTSKKDGRLFTMTHNELVSMERMGDYYYIVKLNWIERILQKKSPEIMVYERPYDTVFKPEQIKEATLYVRR